MAAWVKHTSGWRIRRRGNVALEQDPLFLEARVGDGNRGQQCLRIRHRRLAVEIGALRELDDFPRYITATLSDMCFTTDRSWAMNR